MDDLNLNQMISRLEMDGLNPDNLTPSEVGSFLVFMRELQAYRDGGVTEEILRRNDGYIKVGRGCCIALESEMSSSHPPET